MRFFRLAIILLIGCATVYAAPAGGCVVAEGEQKVYSVLLHRTASEEKNWTAVVEQLTDNSHFAREFNLNDMLESDMRAAWHEKLEAAPSGSTAILAGPPNYTQPIPPGVQRELEQQYQKNLDHPCTIPVLRDKSQHAVFLSSIQIRRTLSKDSIKGWRRFHQRFGENADIRRFSRVAFDQNKVYALVHASWGAGAMAGGGVLYLLKREGLDWMIVREWPTWTT